MAKKKRARKAAKKKAKKRPAKAAAKKVTRRKLTGRKAAGQATGEPPADLARAFQASYAPPIPSGPDTVLLDPDVAPHFRNSRAVNDALRALLRIVRQVRSGAA